MLGRLLAYVSLGLFSCSSIATAQLDQGQIAGTVTDASNAVVPRASVTAKNALTGETLTTETGPNGVYVIPSVRVGTYQVTVTAPGFKQYQRTPVLVNAATRTTLDVVLELGSITESVSVTAPAVQLQQETALVGRLVDDRAIADLALNGRNPINLALLRAGVVGGNFNAFNADSPTHGGLSIAGGGTNDNAVTFDGVNVMRTRGGEAAVGVANVETLQEVQILTTSYPAEFGRTKDGHIRFVTKSGTQEFHGSVYHFFRNAALDANSWTRNRSPNIEESRRPAPFSFNQPGYAIGGPVVIPGKFNQDRTKLFFFVAQEWIRFRRTQTNTGTVPTALMREGDFSELLNPANPFFNTARIVINPYTGAPYPANKIPAPELSSNGMALMRAWPLPTPGFQLGTNNWIQSRPNPRNSRKDFIRLDYYAGSHRVTFSGHNFDYKADDAFRGTFDIAPTRWDRPNRSGIISVTSTFSPTLVNEFSFSAAVDIVKMSLIEVDGTRRWERGLYGVTFPTIFPMEEKIVPNRMPEEIRVTGFSTFDANNRPASSTGPMYTWNDNLTWIRSSHTFKFGISVAKEQHNNNDQTNGINGILAFDDSTHPLATGVAIANLAIGNYTTYGETGKALYTPWRGATLEAYAQDTWKASSSVTLEYGVRYSYHPPWYSKWNDLANFHWDYWDPNNMAQVHPTLGYIVSGNRYNGIVLPGDAYPAAAIGRFPGTTDPEAKGLFHGLPRGLVNSYNFNLAPRFGLAYRVGTETVLRIGGGVFHHRQNLDTSTLIKMPPNSSRADLLNGNIDNPGGGVGRNYLFRVESFSWDAKVPTAYSYSFSIQRRLPGQIVADVSYVGKTGTHLFRRSNTNQLRAGTLTANPGISADFLRPKHGLGVFREREHTGHSSYNSLQVSLDRRFSAGLGFGISYTFSKNIDDTSTPYDAYNWGLMKSRAAMDRTHLMNIHYIYELPFFRNAQGFVRQALAGWQVSGVAFLRSGSWLSVNDSGDRAGVGSGSADQPWNLVGDIGVSGQRGLDRLWFNPAAFARPAPGTFGNAGQRIIEGPGFQMYDLALFKTFEVGESVNLDFRAESFNVLNHPNLNNPGTSPRAANFGVVTSKSGERNVQLGLKLRF